MFTICHRSSLSHYYLYQTTSCLFKPRLSQTKYYELGICCFSTKHSVLRRTSKDWLGRNKKNVSEWREVSIINCCFCDLALYNLNKHVRLVYSGHHYHIIKSNFFMPGYSWKNCSICINNNHSIPHLGGLIRRTPWLSRSKTPTQFWVLLKV